MTVVVVLVSRSTVTLVKLTVLFLLKLRVGKMNKNSVLLLPLLNKARVKMLVLDVLVSLSTVIRVKLPVLLLLKLRVITMNRNSSVTNASLVPPLMLPSPNGFRAAPRAWPVSVLCKDMLPAALVQMFAL